jgi:hypothetical protein
LNYGATNNFELEEGNDKDNVKLVAKNLQPKTKHRRRKTKENKSERKQKAQDVATSQRKIMLFAVQTILSLKTTTTKMIKT